MDAAQRETAALSERIRLLAACREETEAELEPLLAQEKAQAARAMEEELRRRVEAQERRVADLERELADLRSLVQEETARREQREASLRALRTRREQALAEARATQARLEAELELLTRLRQEMAGLAEGTRRILQVGLPGVVGVLGQMIRVTPE